jgi:NTP pyrophosphatase (non-canonical NTP hydrolase)
MADARTTIDDLKRQMRAFTGERQWDEYHTPKNLVLCLAGEVGELCQLFRWLTPLESVERVRTDAAFRADFADELADITNVIALLASHCDLDLSEAIATKMAKNAVKYPPPQKALEEKTTETHAETSAEN